MNSIKHITSGILLLFMQLLVSGYINIWPMLYIAVFPLVLILLPYKTNSTPSMCIAFVLGLLVDILSDGILGLNATSAVALAYFRPVIFRLFVNKNTLENLVEINHGALGLSQFISITALSYATFFIFYITLDSWGYFSFIYTTIRFLINIVANTVIAFLLWKSLYTQIFR